MKRRKKPSFKEIEKKNKPNEIKTDFIKLTKKIFESDKKISSVSITLTKYNKGEGFHSNHGATIFRNLKNGQGNKVHTK